MKITTNEELVTYFYTELDIELFGKLACELNNELDAELNIEL